MSRSKCLDLRSKGDPTLSWSTFGHPHHSSHQVYRGQCWRKWYHFCAVDTARHQGARQCGALFLAGLAMSARDDFEIDMTGFSRACEQDPLPLYLRLAHIVKEGKLSRPPAFLFRGAPEPRSPGASPEQFALSSENPITS